MLKQGQQIKNATVSQLTDVFKHRHHRGLVVEGLHHRRRNGEGEVQVQRVFQYALLRELFFLGGGE